MDDEALATDGENLETSVAVRVPAHAPSAMSWAALFGRAEAHHVEVADIREALTARREKREEREE